MKRRPPDPLRNIIALDHRVDRARDVLQRSTDCDPAFENRVRKLVRLVDQRERAYNRRLAESS